MQLKLMLFRLVRCPGNKSKNIFAEGGQANSGKNRTPGNQENPSNIENQTLSQIHNTFLPAARVEGGGLSPGLMQPTAVSKQCSTNTHSNGRRCYSSGAAGAFCMCCC